MAAILAELQHAPKFRASVSKAWTATELNLVLTALRGFGFPSPAAFAEMCPLDNRTPESVGEFGQTVFTISKAIAAGGSPDQSFLPDKIKFTQADRIAGRAALLEAVRAKPELANLTEGEAKLLVQLAATGFATAPTAATVQEKFARGRAELFMERTARRLMGVEGEDALALDIILPLHVSSVLTLNSLGTIVYDRPGFHSERYLYPAGYQATRLWTSVRNPNEKVWYKSTIVDHNHDRPLFRVELPADDGGPAKVWESFTPSSPWSEILAELNRMRREMDLPVQSRVSVSGPDFFGFAIPQVMELLMRLPNADKCIRFIGRDPRTIPEEGHQGRPKVRRPLGELAEVTEGIITGQTGGAMAAVPVGPPARDAVTFYFTQVLRRPRSGIWAPPEMSNDPAVFEIPTKQFINDMRAACPRAAVHPDPISYILEDLSDSDRPDTE
jgi:hypothetical protein